MEIEKKTIKYDNSYCEEIYHKKGVEFYWHREDGPARIIYDKDGLIKCELYYINDKLHREDGPAYISYNEDGSIDYEEYRINDKLHREDGPSRIVYNKDGSIDYEEYWINDGELSKEEFEAKYPKKTNTKNNKLVQVDFTIKGIKFTLEELKQLQKELNQNLK